MWPPMLIVLLDYMAYRWVLFIAVEIGWLVVHYVVTLGRLLFVLRKPMLLREYGL
jgi:hypothetical protein